MVGCIKQWFQRLVEPVAVEARQSARTMDAVKKLTAAVRSWSKVMDNGAATGSSMG